MAKTLKGKVVLITGGSRGIGRACCLAFARAGAQVAFTYARSRKDAAETAEEVRRLGTTCIALQADVADPAHCKRAFAAVLAKYKRLDILVNNAGITADKPLFMMQDDEWHRVISTNLDGAYAMTRAAITTLLKQKAGCIIMMGSVSGITGLAGQTNYSASKAGMIGFAKALAREAAACNVRVNVVAPGFIETDMLRHMREEARKKCLDAVPLKRFGTAEEVAALCVFLAGDAARYITGEVIRIDGGLAT